jgi:hypothetical protein
MAIHPASAVGPVAKEKSLGIAACTTIVVGNMVGSGFYSDSPSFRICLGVLDLDPWLQRLPRYRQLP